MRENKSWRDSDEFKIEESFFFICLDAEACEEEDCNDCEGAAIINPWIFTGTIKQVQEILEACRLALVHNWDRASALECDYNCGEFLCYHENLFSDCPLEKENQIRAFIDMRQQELSRQ